MTETPFQVATSLVCVIAIVVWALAGRRDRSVGWWAILPISAALATLTYYGVSLLTGLIAIDFQAFLTWGAMARMWSMLMIGAGGLVMLKASRK